MGRKGPDEKHGIGSCWEGRQRDLVQEKGGGRYGYFCCKKRREKGIRMGRVEVSSLKGPERGGCRGKRRLSVRRT